MTDHERIEKLNQDAEHILEAVQSLIMDLDRIRPKQYRRYVQILISVRDMLSHCLYVRLEPWEEEED